MEWIYLNLNLIVAILGVATILLFLFPIFLGMDLFKKNKNKK